MKRRTFSRLAAAAALLAPIAAPAHAQGAEADGADAAKGLTVIDAEGVSLDDFRWRNRLVVVFAEAPIDPRFTEQMQMLRARPDALIERDVVVITDTDPDARSELRQKLRPRGFQLTLIGKDGEVELRKPSPWSSREISRSIDKMPLRLQEIREQKAGAG